MKHLKSTCRRWVVNRHSVRSRDGSGLRFQFVPVGALLSVGRRVFRHPFKDGVAERLI